MLNILDFEHILIINKHKIKVNSFYPSKYFKPKTTSISKITVIGFQVQFSVCYSGKAIFFNANVSFSLH